MAAGVALLIIMITIIVGLILSSKSSNGIWATPTNNNDNNKNNSTSDASDTISANQAVAAAAVTNATLHSVASSGLFLKDGTTWNMNVFSQQTDGNITLQISLDGDKFEAVHNVSFSIKPRIGSPMSEQDQETEVVMVSRIEF